MVQRMRRLDPFLVEIQLCPHIPAYIHTYKNSVAWVRERTLQTEPTPLVGEDINIFADRWCHVVSVTDL
jgi:hypothetical protein